MNNKKSKGMYIHIPFCTSKCGYCDFYSSVCGEEIKKKYTEALCSQIISAAKNYAGNTEISSVYIGGGTPSVLGNKNMELLFGAVSCFKISPEAEITVECNPDSAAPDFFSTIFSIGANRISMGAQSFIDDELRFLGRRHRSKEIFIAVENARKAGFGNISLDLMLAIPLQTENSLRKSLDVLKSISPEHVSAYILKIEENSEFGKKGFSQPEEETVSDMYLKTSEFLIGCGYEHYEISNFAQPEKRAVHNSSYWKGNEYFAFGCGAYGYINKERFHFPGNIKEYIEKNGNVKKITDEMLSAQDICEEKIILSLRTSDGISKELLDNDQTEYLKNLISAGFVKDTAESLSLTPNGFLVSNKIIADIL